MADTLGMLGHYPPWFADASCSQIGGNWWFPERGESNAEAQRICAGCPVRAECRAYALDNEIEHGVWGATTGAQRRKWLRQARAGDPA